MSMMQDFTENRPISCANAVQVGNLMKLLANSKNVFSQCGEDGIIEAIVSKFPSRDHWWVEFGAWDGILTSATPEILSRMEDIEPY